MKVTSYILLRYVLFFVVLHSTNKDVKFVKLSDLKNGEDWFYFVWLFFIPVIIEAIVFGLPMSFGLNKMAEPNNKLIFYLLFVVLFLLEFFLANWLYGTSSAFLKVCVSLVLFLVLFWKRLF